MNPTKVVDPNDFKVVEFHNSTDFDFTPELGAMFDGRALFVSAGERRQFPYHIGHRLAVNLAKAVMIKGAPKHNPNDLNPTGHALWDDVGLEKTAKSFLTNLYEEERPVAVTETDRLMARVADLEKAFKTKAPEAQTIPSAGEVRTEEATKVADSEPKVYADKAEIIAELEKRGIAHNKRMSKAELQKLLV